MITLTSNAVDKIKDLFAEENRSNLKLRVFVQGGGCSGFNYGFAFEEEDNEDDFVVHEQGVSLLVDAMSMQYLTGATIDYKETLMNSSFTIINPNAQTTCGCGSSFSISDDYYDHLGE